MHRDPPPGGGSSRAWHLLPGIALSLCALCSPAAAQKTVEQVWNEEYQELAHQIDRIEHPGLKNPTGKGAMAKVPSAWKYTAGGDDVTPESLLHQFEQWNRSSRERLREEALDPQSLILPADKDPLDVALRRTHALLAYHKSRGQIAPARVERWQSQWAALAADARATAVSEQRKRLFTAVCRLRRTVVLANPLLDFDRIICTLEQPGDYRFAEQARASRHGHFAGGGPLVIENFKSQPRLAEPLADVTVSPTTSSDASLNAWAGKKLTGKFSGLDLSYDGREVLFAATTGSDNWRIFKFDLDRKRLVQLTDGTDDDFDPCYLPSGRIAFVSTRRGGMGRCGLPPASLTYTLYSMEPDGSDLVPLSFHETNELGPSVNHEGKLVYTRWDYVDRHWGTAHHFWECFPDGRDPRSYHGNYPLPWSAMPEGLEPRQYGRRALVYGRMLRPDMELAYRAVPGSPRYTATAVGHHGGFSGSLVMIDPRIVDDGKMAQVRRITPEYFFPEVEPDDVYCTASTWKVKNEVYQQEEFPERYSGAYGTAWPLSEDFYLCNFRWGLYLLDRFGNREVLYDPGRGPYRVRNPFPLRPREPPPALPVLTWQGKRAALADHHRATLSVMNVYTADEVGRLPAGVKIKWLRIVQVIPQLPRFDENEPKRPGEAQWAWLSLVSYASDSIGRIPLGVVPVEEDGSVYCEAPVGKPLYFQLLDERGMAVQSMRSATYVHPGEQLSCLGCHEDKWKPATATATPLALRREPSKIVPEVQSGANPYSFYRLVKWPVLDKKCVGCHKEHPPAPDMSYTSLARHDLAFAFPSEHYALAVLGMGGSRTTPGRFGARASGILQSLTTKEYHKDVKLSPDEWRRLTLWLDLNSNEIGWHGRNWAEMDALRQGAELWSPIDADPRDPIPVETAFPVASRP